MAEFLGKSPPALARLPPVAVRYGRSRSLERDLELIVCLVAQVKLIEIDSGTGHLRLVSLRSDSVSGMHPGLYYSRRCGCSACTG